MPQQSQDLQKASNLNVGTNRSEIIKNEQTKATSLVEIGKPYSFRDEVDPDQGVRKLLEKKMGVMDIVPCHWRFPVVEVENAFQLLSTHIYFDEAIKQFQNACQLYGLEEPEKYNGVRLFTTDHTQSADDIVSNYDQSLFESAIDSIRTNYRHFATFREASKVWRSGTSNPTVSAEQGAKIAREKFNIDASAESPIASVMASGANLVLMGNKISFPKIWRDSTYDPHITINIRLFSPYGHPDAIKQFLIRPLLYLILLLSPKTNDGMSYGHPNPLHVRGYGLTYLDIAYVSQLSWKRGGDDSSFTIYRQPTTIDVSINLHSLIGGFAYYNEKIPPHETKFGHANVAMDETITGARQVSFPTAGQIINSLRPFQYKPGVGNGGVGGGGHMDNWMKMASMVPPESQQFDPMSMINTSATNMVNSINDAIQSGKNTINQVMTGIGTLS